MSTEKRKCKTCLISQPITNYHKNRGKHYRTECKSCRNASRRKPPRGFKKLTQSEIKDIKKRLLEGQKKAPIARLYKVQVPTFYLWIKKGYFA